MTVRELSRRMGMTYNDALRSMKGMRQSGEVVQVGTGGHSGRAAIMQLAEVA
jgi:molybdenum-dependent DNA-binding transcriptional regulator ModE